MSARLLVLVVVVACSGRYHPDDYAVGAVHGPDLKLQTQDCRDCHGSDLAGGTSKVSCDGCHAGATPTTWRQNCTFCHGGVDNSTGAPPRNLDPTNLAGPFPAHTTHVTGGAMANAYDCVQCHTKANDVLSPGHVFDNTPGVAETDFGAGLAPQSVFTRTDGTCTNNYCHGSGRGDDGAIAATAPALACAGCHATQDSGPMGWATMSGPHGVHLATAGVTCADCHASTTTDGVTIASKALHINGVRDVAITAAGFQYDQPTATCTGTCHGFSHESRTWVGQDGSYHPAGWVAPTAHGPAMELQRQDCRGCHGATLAGGTPGGTALVGPSCDGCHTGATTTAWRSNCVFCHGGGLDQTGAPPRDLGSTITSVSQSFRAHPNHVSPTMMSPNDCTTCHIKPIDVMSPNHAFDSTPGVAEVYLTLDGRNPAATYDGMGTCTNLYCHGNGQGNNGTYTDGLGALTCISCHGGRANNFAGLSGAHQLHTAYNCSDCHQAVIGSGDTVLTDVALHINGIKDVQFATGGITFSNGTCNGSCHHGHNNDPWF